MIKNKINIMNNIVVYGVGHFFVEIVCFSLMFMLYRIELLSLQDTFYLFILFYFLAFGMQPFFGFLSDKYNKHKEFGFLGIIFTLIPLFTFLDFPYFSFIILGIGNGMYHVGGGAISLNLRPKKASLPGLFVAPGALGLFLGVLNGTKDLFPVWILSIPLIVLLLLIYEVKIPTMNSLKEKKQEFKHFELIILLICFGVSLRMLIGLSLVLPWKTNLVLALFLALGIMFGKALGGFFADKFGWIKTSVVALLLASFLLFFASEYPIFGILGAFCFNLTMSITLVAISNMLPNNSGFAFGLPCLFLMIGSFIAFFGLNNFAKHDYMISIMTIIYIALIFIGLKLYFKNSVSSDNKQ